MFKKIIVIYILLSPSTFARTCLSLIDGLLIEENSNPHRKAQNYYNRAQLLFDGIYELEKSGYILLQFLFENPDLLKPLSSTEFEKFKNNQNTLITDLAVAYSNATEYSFNGFKLELLQNLKLELLQENKSKLFSFFSGLKDLNKDKDLKKMIFAKFIFKNGRKIIELASSDKGRFSDKSSVNVDGFKNFIASLIRISGLDVNYAKKLLMKLDTNNAREKVYLLQLGGLIEGKVKELDPKWIEEQENKTAKWIENQKKIIYRPEEERIVPKKRYKYEPAYHKEIWDSLGVTTEEQKQEYYKWAEDIRNSGNRVVDRIKK